MRLQIYSKLLFILTFLTYFVYGQRLPVNILNPLNLKNPTTLYALDQYLKNSVSNKTWAILVAGSSGFDNYRHQADVLHLLDVLTKISNIPKEKIIVFATDDLAYSSLNPTKGKIINEPKGKNLYQDLSKEYTRDEVTVENFLKVLNGDQQLAANGKKVLNSKFDENVLIYFSGHGSPGFLNFPDTILKASEFNRILEELANQRKFNKMVVALEACYSGSIFDGDLLKSNLNIYSMTAANSNEVSYSKFYDYDLATYLSDVFSQNLIYSLISCEKNDSTLEVEYDLVKNQTKTSHVSQFGNVMMAKTTKLNEFLSSTNSTIVKDKCSKKRELDLLTNDDRLVWASSEVKFMNHFFMVNDEDHLSKQNESTISYHKELLEKIRNARKHLKDHFFGINEKIAKLLDLNFKNLLKNDDRIRDRKCYEDLVHVYHQNCYKINEHTYLSRYLHMFYKACNSLKDNFLNEQDKRIKNEQMQSLVIDQCKLERTKFTIKVD